MSAKTDQLEIDVARWINRTSEEIHASRPNTSVSFSDVWLSRPGSEPCWLEVKTSHKDNLSNPRVYFDGEWKTTYASPSAIATVEILNTNRDTRSFIKKLSEFSEIPVPEMVLPTSKSFKDLSCAVQIDVLKEFFEVAAPNRYIANVVSYDVGALVTLDMLERNVHYLQAEDDFYLVGNENPMKLPDDIPTFAGDGDFKVRVSTRTSFCEVQSELKLYKLPKSQYSCLPNTDKLNPFSV